MTELFLLLDLPSIATFSLISKMQDSVFSEDIALSSSKNFPLYKRKNCSDILLLEIKTSLNRYTPGLLPLSLVGIKISLSGTLPVEVVTIL